MADDYDTEPAAERPRDAAPWLAMIEEAKRCYQPYQDKCDNIDKMYANLKALSEGAVDREFQIFWANLEVVKPSIYSRPPVPVVVPRFKDRKDLPRKASEMLERSLISSFEADDIDATMRMVRDDLAINSRGVVWLRLEETQNDDGSVSQKVCKEHIERKDFLHDPARKWKEVEWVAKRSFLTRKKGLARFGDVFLKATFKENKSDQDGSYHAAKKAEVWELWHRSGKTVVWVSPGMDEVLDIRPAFLDIDGFFPCPRPAYGTLQRATLTPVPDFVYYKDQVEEINELTARISSLSESLRLKGFYPAGASDVGEAIETVLADLDNRATLVPVANVAAFGDKALKDSIVWLPVREIAEVITQLVALRKQLIDDVYQITGISDIMRGTTEASETLGAQQLKSQYGSIRIRDRQNEMVRLARDVTRIEAEIMAENFEPQTLLEMSQVDDLPTEADIAAQIAQVTQTIQQAMADPVVVEQVRANPQMAQQALQQAQQRVGELEQTVTVEKVVQLFRSQRTRPFVLEIETDSTIQPDEDAAKQRATEFVTAVGGYMGQALPLVQAIPEAAPMALEFLKYIASQFRAGRQMDSEIDAFADKMKQIAAQPKPPPPEQVKAQAEAEARKADAAAKQQDMQAKREDQQAKAAASQRDAALRSAETQQKAAHDERMAAMDERIKGIDVMLKRMDMAIAMVNAKAATQQQEEAA